MNYKEVIEEILREYKSKLEINEDVKIKVKNYKTRAAFSNLVTKTIYINRNLLDLGKDVLRYLMLHEMLHIKLNSKYHNGSFYKMFCELMSLEEMTSIRTKIRERLLRINRSHKAH